MNHAIQDCDSKSLNKNSDNFKIHQRFCLNNYLFD